MGKRATLAMGLLQNLSFSPKYVRPGKVQAIVLTRIKSESCSLTARESTLKRAVKVTKFFFVLASFSDVFFPFRFSYRPFSLKILHTFSCLQSCIGYSIIYLPLYCLGVGTYCWWVLRLERGDWKSSSFLCRQLRDGPTPCMLKYYDVYVALSSGVVKEAAVQMKVVWKWILERQRLDAGNNHGDGQIYGREVQHVCIW